MQKDKIGPYKILKKAGEGAFGIVWKTEHTKDKNPYAIKEISKKRMTSQLMENLIREVHISFNLKHKNIVKCYNTLESKNNYYIIFEFCKGGDLEKYMKKKKRIELNEALYLMKQIRDAYKYLLSQNILHRDIKLENILIDDDESLIVKLSDFGCSKVDPIGTTICGTPKYMALEVMENENNYNYKADLWSIGLCFWELVFGIDSFPFSQKSREALKTDIKKFSGPNLRFPKLPKLPDMFYDFFKNILNVSPKLRMEAEEFINHAIFEYEQSKQSMIQAMNGLNFKDEAKTSKISNSLKKTKSTNKKRSRTPNKKKAIENTETKKTKAILKIKKFYNTKIVEVNLIKSTCSKLNEHVKDSWDVKYSSYFKCLLIILLKKANVKAEVCYKSLHCKQNSFQLDEFDEFISFPNEYNLLKDELQEIQESIKKMDDEIYSKLIHECYSEEYLAEINGFLYLGNKTEGKSKFIGSTWKVVYNKFKKYVDDYEQGKFEKLLFRVSIILKGKVLENLNAFY